MEVTEGQAGEIYEARKLQVAAIRCAKAALLLCSLKSSPDRVSEAADNEEHEEKEKMRREIKNLRMELVMKRLKMKEIKFRRLMKCFLQLIVVMLILGIFTKIALDFFLLEEDDISFCT